MKTLKVLLQEVVSGIKAWVNSNFAQESNTVHKTGNETVNGVKTFTTDARSNTRFEHRDTVISSKEAPSSERKTDTFSHIGGDGTYWGGLKHCWYASGISATQICVANHKLNGSTWTQGFWAINLGASKDFSSVYFAPTTNNGINLGTANYQWNNVYAKNYYYNGTAWGLDKDNVWGGHNRFYKNASLSSISTWSDPTMAFSATFNTILFNTRGSANFPSYGTFLYAGYESTLSPVKFGVLKLVRSTDKKGDTNDGLIPDTSFNMMTISPHYLRMDIMESVKIQNDGSVNQVIPLTNNVTDLGTSTNKWKTFNGVNPGELSLPNMGTSVSQTIDITDWYVPDPDDPTYPDENAKKIDDSVEHTIESSSHVGAGYIHIAIPNVSGNYAYARQYAMETNMNNVKIADGLAFDAFPNISFIFPIVNALKVRIKAKTATVRFFPCLGNV